MAKQRLPYTEDQERLARYAKALAHPPLTPQGLSIALIGNNGWKPRHFLPRFSGRENNQGEKVIFISFWLGYFIVFRL